jgi:hypothetical protein
MAWAPRVATLPLLIKLKRRWNVSLVALIHRLHDLRLISDWQYRTLCVQAAENGYRTADPNSCQREASLLLQKAFAFAREDGLSRGDVAERLRISRADLDALVFGLVFTSINRGVPPTSDRVGSTRPEFEGGKWRKELGLEKLE